jgi:hypothetical protein
MGRRWKEPILAKEFDSGHRQLQRFFPGRVLSVTRLGRDLQSVRLVLGTPEDRRVLVKDFSASDWRDYAGSVEPEGNAFVELAVYDANVTKMWLIGIECRLLDQASISRP